MPLMLDMLKIDDVVGAIPAHLFAGIWGTLVVAWTNPDAKLAVQAIGVVSYGVFALVASFIDWFIIKAIIYSYARHTSRSINLVY